MAEKSRLGYQIFMIAFLLMIIIGFTLPGILDKQDAAVTAEQRVCQTDAECYLMCDGTPVSVLCSQNLCQQNSCEEQSLYPFQETPVTFTFKIDIPRVTLQNRTSSSDLFILFSGNTVRAYSSLSLGIMLEKFQMQLLGTCLKADGQQYCSNEQKELIMTVNGESSYQYEQYVPQEGDVIIITYS